MVSFVYVHMDLWGFGGGQCACTLECMQAHMQDSVSVEVPARHWIEALSLHPELADFSLPPDIPVSVS